MVLQELLYSPGSVIALPLFALGKVPSTDPDSMLKPIGRICWKVDMMRASGSSCMLMSDVPRSCLRSFVNEASAQNRKNVNRDLMFIKLLKSKLLR